MKDRIEFWKNDLKDSYFFEVKNCPLKYKIIKDG